MTEHSRHFWAGCVTELALLGLAWLLAWLLNWPLLHAFGWNPGATPWGVAAALPMFAVFYWELHSAWRGFASIRRFLEHVVRPVFGPWSILQLLVISILAGVCEEALFRGLIQGWLTQYVGPWVAIPVASVAFGLAHPINRPYIIAAMITGIYLGLLFWMTGDLLAPIVAHALYDFLALIYFLRLHRSDPR